MRADHHARALTALVVAAVAVGGVAAAAPASAAPRPDTERGATATIDTSTDASTVTSTDASTDSSTSTASRHTAHFPTGWLSAKTLVPRLSEAMLEAASLTTTTRTSDALGPIESVVDVDMPTSNSRIHLSLPEGPVELRTVDGRRYLQAPETEGMFYDATSEDTSRVRISVGVDPVRPVRALFGAIVDVRRSGAPVDLDGVTTQPYEVVVATARLQDGLGDLGAGIPRDQLPATVTLTYWVDEQDRLRRATSDIAGTPVEMLFTNWGADFGIEAPPQDQIAHLWPSTR